MYLPSEYLWGLISGVHSEGEEDGDASLPPLMPPYGGPKAANVSADED